MIDDPAQSTGLVVKVGDQRRKLCLGNTVYRGHTLARYVCGQMQRPWYSRGIKTPSEKFSRASEDRRRVVRPLLGIS